MFDRSVEPAMQLGDRPGNEGGVLVGEQFVDDLGKDDLGDFIRKERSGERLSGANVVMELMDLTFSLFADLNTDAGTSVGAKSVLGPSGYADVYGLRVGDPKEHLDGFGRSGRMEPKRRSIADRESVGVLHKVESRQHLGANELGKVMTGARKIGGWVSSLGPVSNNVGNTPAEYSFALSNSPIVKLHVLLKLVSPIRFGTQIIESVDERST